MRRKGKKFLGILLSLVLVVGMLPAMSMTVHADTLPGVKYLDANGVEQTCTNYTLVTTGTTWSGGWYIVNTNVEFDNKVEATGDINLILCDNAKLELKGGIESDHHGINIYAQSIGEHMGKLTANSGLLAFSFNRNVGIYGGNITTTGGSGFGIEAGSLTIKRATVTASSNSGPGIVSSGGINISSGNVTATGGSIDECGEGIKSDDGNITISGGTVEAKSTSNNSYGIRAVSGAVNISGGEVNVTSTNGGSIFAGDNSKISGGTVTTNRSIVVEGGDLEITGGNITANNGIGIFTDKGYPPTNKGGNLTISGGTVTAKGDEYGISSESSITISGGTVTAENDYQNHGFAIGSGGNFKITGGKVEATSNGSNAIDSSGTLEISGDSEVTATGTGDVGWGTIGINAHLGFNISGGKVTASSSGTLYGIYSNKNSTITGGTVKSTGYYGIQAWEVLEISGGSLTAIGNICGIDMRSDYVLTVTGGTVSATGDGAISGTVKNEITGTGWTNREGTEGMKLIPVNTSGNSYSYDKIQFPALAAKVTTPPKAKTLTFNQQAQELIDTGVAENGTMMYAVNKDATTAPTTGWDTTIPKETKVGTYYVWYYAKGTGEYDDSAIDKIAVTIKDKPSDKEAIEGNGQTVRSGFPAVFTFDVEYEDFIDRGAVYVDGSLVDSKFYDAKPGSTIITLKEEFIDSLSEGSHTVTITLADVKVGTATFNVTKTAPENNEEPAAPADNKSPATGDSISNILLLFLISFIGLAGIGLYTKKKELFNK